MAVLHVILLAFLFYHMAVTKTNYMSVSCGIPAVSGCGYKAVGS